MTTPDISVHVMVCNSERYLPGCLASLRRQTYADFEVLMMDAGSTDRSSAICAEAERADARFRHIRYNERLSVGHTRADALAQSRGAFVAVLDSDDEAHPERFALQRAWLDRHPATVLLGSHYRVINAQGLPLRLWPIHFRHDIEIRWRLTFGNCLTQSTIMFRRAAAQASGGYDPGVLAAEDLDFYSKLLGQGRFHTLARPLINYRTHAESLSNTEPRVVKDRFPDLVRASIERQLGISVSREVAGAVYNQSKAPAASAAVAADVMALIGQAEARFFSERAETPLEKRLLGRTVFLHLLQFMTKNSTQPWWPSIEPEWHALLKQTVRGADGRYNWRTDPGLVWHTKDILKSAPRALWLAVA